MSTNLFTYRCFSKTRYVPVKQYYFVTIIWSCWMSEPVSWANKWPLCTVGSLPLLRWLANYF